MRAIFFGGVAIAAAYIFANPQNPTVVSGNLSFSNPDSSTLLVSSSSNRSIVNWDSFSIDRGETTQILLPAASSAILNRVTSGSPSSLMGHLESNGQIFLINPNGIVVSREGMVNAAAVVLSTLDTSDAGFLGEGNLTFQGNSTAALINQGKIAAFGGDAVLLGYIVSNEGTVVAQSGVAALGAGQQIILQPLDDQRIAIVPQASPFAPNGLTHSGYIAAVQAELKADGNVYALAINQTGFVNAIGVGVVNGRVFLRAAGGTTVCNGDVSAQNSDNTGGVIHVLGMAVTIDDGGTLYTASNGGGGTIFVGGSPGGLDPQVLNAVNTTVGTGARIVSDAFREGNGGTVSVFATGTTDFLGSITARGGPSFGNGGDVHISGLVFLNYFGMVDVAAYNGMDGSLTFDPLIFHGTVPPGARFE